MSLKDMPDYVRRVILQNTQGSAKGIRSWGYDAPISYTVPAPGAGRVQIFDSDVGTWGGSAAPNPGPANLTDFFVVLRNKRSAVELVVDGNDQFNMELRGLVRDLGYISDRVKRFSVIKWAEITGWFGVSWQLQAHSYDSFQVYLSCTAAGGAGSYTEKVYTIIFFWEPI